MSLNKSMDFSIKVLTIPRHQARNWTLVAHLEDIGYPVRSLLQDGTLAFYNGIDFMENPALNKGACIKMGFHRLFEIIAEQDNPVLLIESDCRFAQYQGEILSCSVLKEKWNNLVEMEDYDNIHAAMLWFANRSVITFELPCEPLDDFWGSGVKNAGQIANIWTPHGAKWVLDFFCKHGEGSTKWTRLFEGQTFEHLFVLLRTEYPMIYEKLGVYTSLKRVVQHDDGNLDAVPFPKNRWGDALGPKINGSQLNF